MIWLETLNQTYDNCRSEIGKFDKNGLALLPIFHTTQRAQIEVILDLAGNFLKAGVVPKNQAKTIIPCTEDSANRTSSKIAPHPLCDKLQYVAGDYKKFGGRKKNGFEKYLKQLQDWVNSSQSDPKLLAVLKYVSKSCLIRDLVQAKVLWVEADNQLMKQWHGETKPPEIFKVCQAEPEDAFVRWAVEEPGNPVVGVYADSPLFDKWIAYCVQSEGAQGFCQISGTQTSIARLHPKKIINDSDGTKLICENKDEFAYLGRFQNSDQACQVGLKLTNQAHNALRWLIRKQGYNRYDKVFVAWATNGKDIPSPTDDAFAFFTGDDTTSMTDTAADLALKLRKKIAGYGAKLGNTDRIIIMGLDAFTPGRRAIVYYREIAGDNFLDRLEQWHTTCCWVHTYRSKEFLNPKTGKLQKINLKFLGAPSPYDIAIVAYDIKDKKGTVIRSTIERLLPCIVDGQPIPVNLVKVLVSQASKQGIYKESEICEWEKLLSIACAVYRRHHYDCTKEVINLKLDRTRSKRDYLFGRLLAVSDVLEAWALKESNQNRQTTASRLMQRFSERPFSTWKTIHDALGPYKAKLIGKYGKYEKLFEEIHALFEPEDFISDKPLSGEYLLSYYCQKDAMYNAKEEDDHA